MNNNNSDREDTQSSKMKKRKVGGSQPTTQAACVKELPYFLLMQHEKRKEFLELSEKIFGKEAPCILMDKVAQTMPSSSSSSTATDEEDELDVVGGKSVPLMNANALRVLRDHYDQGFTNPTKSDLEQLVATAFEQDSHAVTKWRVYNYFCQRRYQDKKKANENKEQEVKTTKPVRTRILSSGRRSRGSGGSSHVNS